MLNRAACFSACLALIAAAMPATVSARAERGPALTIPSGSLRNALTCNGSLRHARRAPVLLVHGTFADSKINWGWNYKKALPARGNPACTVDLPDRSAGDIQASSEYVVYAIRAMARRSGRDVVVIALSQGGLNTRWALRWWPDLRQLVSDVVLFATPNHGSKFTNGVCTSPGLCATALYQMRSDSELLRVLDQGHEALAGVDFTAISTADDTVFVTPPEARLQGARNIVVQDLCPGHRVDHVGLAYDGPTYAIAVDALDHAGPAKPKRVGPALCRHDTMPGVTRPQADAKVRSYQGKLNELLGPNGPKAQGEPPLARYATRR